ncbi:MAG: hypothetical protein DMF03_02370 [Verrucomicrobia bacterium]|nr:MAG: hypothetical protein DMF03_02370 [Verrucomicrobiota bacterium]
MNIFSLRGFCIFFVPMRNTVLFLVFSFIVGAANAQIQVQLKFNRLQYIAYEPLIATVTITNRAGRDIDLRDEGGQHWFGFEVTRNEGQSIGPATTPESPPLQIEASQSVTQKINLTPLFPMQDFGAYHVRAHVYFADLGRYFYSPAKVIEITDARPIWKQSVGVPGSSGAGGDVRTYSLMTNRFPDHTSLYVRVEDENRGIVYATYSLGHVIAFDEPHAEIDRENRLHVLHCAGPRVWSYVTIGLNGQLLARSTLVETKTRPHFKRTAEGDVAIIGGMTESAAARAAENAVPKLSTRPDKPPGD